MITIVIFHWGNEKEEVPDSNQMTLGRLAIDEGADLVCGHHPHVLQGIEEYKGKNIVYSLGNFCFGGNSYPSDMDTMIFQQTFTVDKNGVKADNVTNVIPCSISSEYDYNNYQPLLPRVTRRTGSCPKFRKEAPGSRLPKPLNRSVNPVRNLLICLTVILDQRIPCRNKRNHFSSE